MKEVTRRGRASPPCTRQDQAEDETRHSHIAGGGVHGDQRAARGLPRPGHPQLLRPRLPVTPHLAQHRGVVPAAGPGRLHCPQRSQDPQHPRDRAPAADNLHPHVLPQLRHHQLLQDHQN